MREMVVLERIEAASLTGEVVIMADDCQLNLGVEVIDEAFVSAFAFLEDLFDLVDGGIGGRYAWFHLMRRC